MTYRYNTTLNLYANAIRERYIKSFLDIHILCLLKEEPMHGYRIITEIYERHQVFISPGTLYPRLNALEKEELIKSQSIYVKKKKRKKIYLLTEKGSETLEILLKALSKIQRGALKEH
ncbi:MAG: PadR family transcriptional regulator [Candidatus Geothermarchaeales archaeon]